MQQPQGQGKRLILAAIGLLIAVGGFALLAAVTVDRSPDKDAFMVGGIVSGAGLFFTGIGLFGAGKHTSGFAFFAAIFCIIGGIGHGAGIPIALDSSGSDGFFLLTMGSMAGGLGVFFLGLWAVTSVKTLGVFGLICGIFVTLAGLSMTGFWLGIFAEVLKLGHVSEAVPGVYGAPVFWGFLLALRLFGKTKPKLA